MDISKICIDTPETTYSASSFSTISTPSEHRDSLSQVNANNSIKNNKHTYQLQYQLQHQYLKSYGAREQYYQQEQPILEYSSSNHANQRNLASSSPSSYYTKPLSTLFNGPRPIAPQIISSSSTTTSLPSSYQQQQHQSSSKSFSLPPPPTPPPPPPPSSNHLPTIQPAPSSPIKHTQPLNTPDNDSNISMKHIIEQCTSIYQRIGKYRTDPLRESERNQIIDYVFFTAEDMLKSLNTLNDRFEENDINVTNLSIDSPSILNNNTRQMDFANEDDSAPPSGNESTMEEYKMIRQARNLQKNARPKYRRRSRTSMVGHRCHSCNTMDTPEWRRGPDGARTLCNACGLHYSKLLKKGSLTVQTHNYMIEAPPEGPQQQPRAIQFPIIQVNNIDKNAAMRSLPESSTTTKLSFSKYNASARIVEMDEEEEFVTDVDMM